ncbi:hypothetical protein GGF46_001354 [Coemansia sp. RSA 552]|nr:hypothetical protein GGF46_001354 [Coemansia sp. RSA 552]
MDQLLPYELMAAVCRRLAPCPCAPDSYQSVFSQSCTGHHAPGPFGRTALSELRQTSRAWRAAALDTGLSQIVASSRWMRGSGHDRLADIRASHGRSVRRLVFRAADLFPGSGGAIATLEAALALEWPCLDAIVIDWFSGSADDQARIAAAVQHWAPRIRELFVRDKHTSLAQVARLAGPSGCPRIRHLAAKPYGYDQRWDALAPAERGAASLLRFMPRQLMSLAVGGADFTPELLAALQVSQPCLARLSVEHAWALPALGANDICLPAVTRLDLANVIVGDSLPVSARMFPQLRSLSVRDVWQSAPLRLASARGAVSMQDPAWLGSFLAQCWPHLRSLALPAIADADATALARACPALERLTTGSLDYAGPLLSAAGLVATLRLPRLRYLAIEQRRADGTPGYHVADADVWRLLGLDDEDAAFGRRMLRCTASNKSIGPPALGGLARDLATLCLPRAAFAPATLIALTAHLPNLVRLSVSLRAGSGLGPRNGSSNAVGFAAHTALRFIAISADEDVLTDPRLSAWLVQRFPALQECSTNHARSHRRMVSELRSAAPAISFTRLSSRALQTCS